MHHYGNCCMNEKMQLNLLSTVLWNTSSYKPLSLIFLFLPCCWRHSNCPDVQVACNEQLAWLWAESSASALLSTWSRPWLPLSRAATSSVSMSRRLCPWLTPITLPTHSPSPASSHGPPVGAGSQGVVRWVPAGSCLLPATSESRGPRPSHHPYPTKAWHHHSPSAGQLRHRDAEPFAQSSPADPEQRLSLPSILTLESILREAEVER